MPVSPGYPDVRECSTDRMRLTSAGQRHSPVFSSPVNGADPNYSADFARLASQERNRQSTGTSSHDGHSQKCGDERCREDEAEEETEDDYDDFEAFSVGEACYAVYNTAAGRTLAEQARDVLVPPCSPSPLSAITSKACVNSTAAGVGRGASGGHDGQRAEKEDATGAPSILLRGTGRQESSNTPRSSSSGSFGSRCGDNVSDSSTGRAANSDLPAFVGKRGGSQGCVLRRLLWLRLLGVLQDADPLSWAQQVQQHREVYMRLQEEEERQLSAKRLTMLDPQRFHPLAATADNPWSKRQQNEALLLEIWKDVERTLAERRLFRTESTRKSLQRILFTWSRRNPEVSYKQGMNELLSIFYLVCYREKVHMSSTPDCSSRKAISSRTSNSKTSIDSPSTCNSEDISREFSGIITNAAVSDIDGKRDTDSAVAEVSCAALNDKSPPETSKEAAVQVLLSADPAAVEADAFVLFEAVMNRFMLKAAYLPAPSAPTTTGGGVPRLQKGSSGGGRFVSSATTGLTGGLPPLIARSSIATASKSALLWRCNYLFETLLPFVDRPLYEHLKSEEVEPQLFLLRWIRLLFSREFHIEDTLLLWDAIFADAYLHEVIERGGQHTSPYQPAGSLQQSSCSVLSTCEEKEEKSRAAKPAVKGPAQQGQEQQQQLFSMKNSKSLCTVTDPFKSLLRYTAARPGISSAVEVTYDPAQVGTAAAAKLPLLDYFVLAMLEYVRETLLGSNQILCLRRLLRFPPTESIQPLVLLAVSLRTRRLPQLGRSINTAAVIQHSLTSPVNSHMCPPFPSISCTQPQQSQPQLQQKQQDPHQAVHEEQQQQQRKKERGNEQEILGGAIGAGLKIPQEAATVEQQRNIQQASSQDGTSERKFSPLSLIAAATTTNNCAGSSSHNKATSAKPFSPHCQEDLLLAARPCMAAPPLLGLMDGDAASAGVHSDQPAVAASAPADSVGNTTRMSNKGNISNRESKDPRCNSGTVQVDIRSAAVGGDRCASTPEVADLDMSGSNSSRSIQLRGKRETDTNAAESDSSTIPGRTISRHVEEVAADIRAALALWSSKELLSTRRSSSSSSRQVMTGAGTREEAQEPSLNSCAQRMQAAEERIAGALVRLQLLQKVLDGDIAYSSSLFPPAAGSSLCAAAVSAAGETTGTPVNCSRNEYIVESVAGHDETSA